MKATLLDTYIDELQFLMALKQTVGILHNRIHDKLSLIAIEKLRARHPTLDFRYQGAGARGIDIQGFDTQGNLKLIAEAKTTHPTDNITLRVQQVRNIERDIQRLADTPGDVERYFVVLSQQTKSAVERQLTTATRFPTVQIIDALGLVVLVQPQPTDDADE